MYKLDKEGFDACLKKSSLSDTYHERIDDVTYLTSGLTGGITLEDYFIDNFYKITMNELETRFMKLMHMIEPLFLGLKELHNHKLIHNDIKGINIVLHNNVFKYIDFGLAGNISDKKHFRDRALSEFDTSRIYIYYPIEYIYFYCNNNELNDELNYIQNGDVRRHFDDLVDFYSSLFNKDFYDINEDIINQLKKKMIDETTMLTKIDTYSLGNLIPLLFMYESNIEFPHHKNQKINEFYDLFKDMTEPLSKDRIEPIEAYNRFKKLLSKSVIKNCNNKLS